MKREAVAYLRAEHGLSERRTCHIVDADRTMIRYRSQRAPDTVLRGRLRDLANARRRFAYRRLFVLQRREGEPSGINRIYRLYHEEGLTVRKRKARGKAVVRLQDGTMWNIEGFPRGDAGGAHAIRPTRGECGHSTGTDLSSSQADGPSPLTRRRAAVCGRLSS